MKNYFNSKALALIATTTLAFMLLGLLLGNSVLKKYRSEGFMSIPMSVSEYQRFREATGSVATLRQALNVLPPAINEDLQAIERVVFSTNDKWHLPLPRISTMDSKDLPDALLKLELENERLGGRAYVGAKIIATSQDAEQAARIASWLGSYFKEVAAREATREQIFDWVALNRQSFDRAQEQKLKLEFEIEQAQNRAVALKKVLSQYPELSKSDTRQVIDVRKDNEKFMSPMAQLVGAEIEVIDIREKLSKLERSLVQQSFAKGYLVEAEQALSAANTGSELINALGAITKKYMATTTKEAEREMLLSLAATVSRVNSRFLVQAQFVLQPSVPARPEAPRPIVFAAFFTLLGLLISVIWVSKAWIKAQFLSSFAATAAIPLTQVR
jgi:hypothetical protein